MSHKKVPFLKKRTLVCLFCQVFAFGFGAVGTLTSCSQIEELSFLAIYRADTNGSIDGKPRVLQSVMSGGSTSEVTAIPFEGFVFLQWDDGLKEATRIDREIYKSFERIAYFVQENSFL